MQSPARTSTLTSKLIPRPKNALTSPRVQKGTVTQLASRCDVDVKTAKEVPGLRDPSEDPVLRGDHAEGDLVELREVGAAAVAEHEALKAAVVGLPDRGVHADLGRHAGDHEAADAEVPQDELEVGRVEGALAGLVDHDLAGRGSELVDDFVAALAAHEDAPVGTGVADAGREAATRPLARRAVRHVGPMALAGVDDRQSRCAGRGEAPLSTAPRPPTAV